jgi:hypothetical protein
MAFKAKNMKGGGEKKEEHVKEKIQRKKDKREMAVERVK